MREFKFRIFDKNKNKMFPVIKLSKSFPGDCEVDYCYYLNSNDKLEYLPLTEGVLMQYIGLKDKKDKEIYEGDICKWNIKSYINNKNIGNNDNLKKWLKENNISYIILKIIKTDFLETQINAKYYNNLNNRKDYGSSCGEIFAINSLLKNTQIEIISNIYKNNKKHIEVFINKLLKELKGKAIIDYDYDEIIDDFIIYHNINLEKKNDIKKLIGELIRNILLKNNIYNFCFEYDPERVIK